MRMRKLLPLCLIAVMLTFSATAQEKWDLRKCVEYAIANNISVKQADVQKRIAEVQMKQDQMALFPSFGLSTSQRFGFGRARDFQTQEIVTRNSFSSNYGVQSSVTLFNFFSLVNIKKSSEYAAEASANELDRVRNDVSLNVSAAYLQALLAIEQHRVANVQLEQTKDQLANTRRLVDAGSLPELNAAELEAQLARDTAALVSAYATILGNKLQLKALLNIDVAEEFLVESPEIDDIFIEPISELQPDVVYQLALQNQPLQKANRLRVLSADLNAKAARAQMYPNLSLSLGMGTDYSNLFERVLANGQRQKIPYFNQISDNISQFVGFSLNVPIFQNYTLKGNYRRAQLNTENVLLNQEQDNYNLKQSIYQAYIDATTSLQTFNAQKTAVQTAEKSYNFTKLRYDEGLLNTIDLILSQSNLTRAKIEMLSAQYDYVFKMKVLEFYKGQGLKL